MKRKKILFGSIVALTLIVPLLAGDKVEDRVEEAIFEGTSAIQSSAPSVFAR